MLDKVLPAVLRAVVAIAKNPLQRSELYIKTLKNFGWTPDHPPADFSGIYAYTLVEYALTDEEEKPEALLKLFGEPEIRDAFRQAFDQWEIAPLNAELERRLDWKDFDSE
jgi:predicted NACHT family NTPase